MPAPTRLTPRQQRLLDLLDLAKETAGLMDDTDYLMLQLPINATIQSFNARMRHCCHQLATITYSNVT